MAKSKAAMFLLASAAAIGLATPAHAYLDPGTGSFLLQLLLGGAAGALVIAKLYWQRMRAFFLGPSADKDRAPGAPDHD